MFYDPCYHNRTLPRACEVIVAYSRPLTHSLTPAWIPEKSYTGRLGLIFCMPASNARLRSLLLCIFVASVFRLTFILDLALYLLGPERSIGCEQHIMRSSLFACLWFVRHSALPSVYIYIL